MRRWRPERSRYQFPSEPLSEPESPDEERAPQPRLRVVPSTCRYCGHEPHPGKFCTPGFDFHTAEVLGDTLNGMGEDVSDEKIEQLAAAVLARNFDHVAKPELQARFGLSPDEMRQMWIDYILKYWAEDMHYLEEMRAELRQEEAAQERGQRLVEAIRRRLNPGSSDSAADGRPAAATDRDDLAGAGAARAESAQP